MNNTEQGGLQRERTGTGLTQAELGRLLGVSQATISLWENGKARPDEVQADALRALFQRGASSSPTELKPDLEGFDVPFTLSTMNNTPDAELTSPERHFFASMELNSDLFGVHAFRKSALGTSDGNRSVLNIAFFDVFSVGLSVLGHTPVTEQQRKLLKTAIRDLLQNDAFVHAITYSTNSRKQVAKRFEQMDSKLESVRI